MSSIPREALNASASKPGVIGVPSSTLSAFFGIGNVGRGDLVHHVGGGVPQHPLGADVEDLNDALRVGRDTREVGAVENRALQRLALQQGHFRLSAKGDITQQGGEIGAAGQLHLAHRDLDRE
jgi:hypothetical protein